MQRRVMIDRLTYDPEVMDAALDYAQNNQIPEKSHYWPSHWLCKRNNTIVFSNGLLGFATKLARIISRLIYRGRILIEKEKGNY